MQGEATQRQATQRKTEQNRENQSEENQQNNNKIRYNVHYNIQCNVISHFLILHYATVYHLGASSGGNEVGGV